MKYEKGDKFIIEISGVIPYEDDDDIYVFEAGSEKSIVFTQRTLDRLEQLHEHNGCDGCRYEHLVIGEEPCIHCNKHYTDRWTPKTEDIQVGDEVEHEDGRKSVVVNVREVSVTALIPSSINGIATVLWPKHNCTRTGKTYPELIKALEELPKE